jgi:hypothetical protein
MKVKVHRFCRMLMTIEECCQLMTSPDDVDSVFFKYHLIKAKSARQITACKCTFIEQKEKRTIEGRIRVAECLNC